MDEQTKRLFEEQKRTLELFVERNAISQEAYEQGQKLLKTMQEKEQKTAQKHERQSN